MSISLFLVGGGVGLLIITFVYPVGGDLIFLGLILVGLGGIFAIGELAGAALSRKSHSDKPEAEKARSNWGSWVALLIFGLIVYIIWSFLNWLPGPIWACCTHFISAKPMTRQTLSMDIKSSYWRYRLIPLPLWLTPPKSSHATIRALKGTG